MKLFVGMVIICAANCATIVWAVSKQPGPQIMCPMKVKPNMRGKWFV